MSRNQRDTEINIGGNVSDSTIHIGDTTTVGYTSEEVTALLTQITSTFQPKPFDGRCPYKGLDVFEEDDAELFFGREKLVGDLVGRVRDSRTLFITGPSGSGKSSLARAGLIHALKRGAIKGSERWLYATMKPGRDPIGELGRVAAGLAGTTNAEDEIREKSMKEASIFSRWCEIALKEGREKRFILFIDQFEEVFTQINREEERVAFLNLLTHAAEAEGGRLNILFAMRSDFVPNCATYPQLNALLNRQFIQIGAMQPEELVSAIAQPALRVGLRIDPDLVAQVINDMKGEPGALPLMQFALKDLFDAVQARGGMLQLTLDDYLQRGGIQKSLERHADAAFARLGTNEQKLARSIFSGLIEIGRGTQDTKRTANFDELIPANAKGEEVKAIIRKLADARLITTDETAGKDTVAISHEKLIDAWPWLKKLVNENRDVIALQNEITSDAKEWDEHKRDASYLYTGGRLANVHEQLADQKLILNGLAQEFVKAGKTKQQRNRRLLVGVIATAFALLVIAVIVFSRQSNANAELAQQNANIASTAEASANVAATEKSKAEEQANIALARQLAAQAHLINMDRSSNQMTATLLAIQSLKLFPTGDAARYLINNNFSAFPVSLMTHDDFVTSVAFSPDGKYVISGSGDGTARIWEAESGKEVARMIHNGSVHSVAFSPDGKYVVSGSDDETARVWEAGSGKEVARMIHDGSVDSVAFSPDGKYVVSAGNYFDLTARIWEADTGKEIARLNSERAITSVTFSPDGKYVISGGNDNTARVWEADTGKEIAYMIYDYSVNSVTISPNGKYVASGSDDHTARVWEAATGKEVARMPHGGVVQSVAFSSDGKYVVSASFDNTARVWESATGEEVARMTHDAPVWSVTFSPDDKYVMSGSVDDTARVWEAGTGKEVARMTHDNPVRSVAFSPNGRYAVSAGDDKTVRVWRVSTGKEVARMTHDGIVYSAIFGPDGKYVVSGDGSIACVWEASTGTEIARINHDDVISVAFSPDGNYVASGSYDYTARVWEVSTGKEIARMTHDYWVNFVAFSPDGKYVVSGSDDGTARVWETGSGKELARMTHDDKLSSVALSPDGRYIASGSWNGIARMWETSTGREIARMAHDGTVSSVAFSPDGKYVVSGGGNTARVWEAGSGKEVARMMHDKAVSAVAFSPDGKYVVSGSDDNTARVWEAGTGREIAGMTHDSPVTSVDFSPDGKYVVSGSDDNTARVWEAATGEEVARITHDDIVDSVAFSPDGRYVVSGSEDNTARVWMWQSNDLIENACKYMPRNLTRAEWKQYIGDALPYQAVCENLPIEP
jgi:uncharacterized delta-60 repeat protein